MMSPFLSYTKQNELVIEFIGEINFSVWATWYSEIQNKIIEATEETICINFKKCKTCISISFVSLFLSLIRKQVSGCKIKIELYKDSGEYDATIYWIFANMGIFDLCIKYGIEVIVDESCIINSEKNNCLLQISSDVLVPLIIVNTKEIQNIYTYIKELVELRIRNFECEESTRVKIENILFETVDNIRKHAYPGFEDAFAGVYIQKKDGLLGKELRIDQKRELLNKIKKDYGNNYDGIDLDYLQQKQTYYEIIIMDEGVGITNTLEIKNIDGQYTKYPFLQSFKRTLIEGERKKYIKQEEKSHYSGLNLVFKLLAEKSDYIYGKEKDLYVYAQCGRSKPNIFHNLHQNVENTYRGLMWIFHIGEEPTTINEYYSYQPKVIRNETLLRIYEEKEKISYDEFGTIGIWDERKQIGSINNLFYDRKLSFEKAIEYIWLIEGHYGKNAIIKEIENKMSSIKNENTTLLIADVFDTDMMIFYMALHNTNLKNVKCNKIIIISKTLRSAIFERKKNGVFYYEKSLAIKFYKEKISNKLEDSIVQVFRFLRKYDSSIWWSKVLQSEKNIYWIKRGRIKWEQFILKYYINLEMMLENNDLFELVQYSLERVKGLSGKFGEFKDTDIIMKKVCIAANQNKKSKGLEYSRIYVESVYVSGKTDQILNLRNMDIKLCLFQTEYLWENENNTKNVAHIFIWPVEEILARYVKSDENLLERKHNTHTIQVAVSKDASADIIEKKKNSNYKKDYYDVLYDMSYIYDGFVKLGHFNYHSNHDIFAFNIIAILKMGFYEKNGPFLFLLRKFVNCLGKKAYDILKSEWKKVFGEVENLVETSSIVVYRSHYYTDYIIKLLYQCFEENYDSMWNLVIPLDSIEEKNYMNPLTISDIQYQYIEDTVEKNSIDKKCRVAIWDSMITTGQTSRDIKNIFDSILIGKDIELVIDYIYLFDCENMQYERNNRINFEAYYRVDIPRIGRKKSCLFCRLIENMSKYINIFISTLAKQRILRWIEIWRPISPLYAKNNLGFSNSKVENWKILWKEIGINTNIEYCDFYTLATQLVEIGYTNRDKEFLYDICTKEELFSVEQKIQLLEIQLLLFSTDENYKLYYKVIRKLIKYMNQLEVTSNATALAAMLIISGDKEAVYAIFKEMSEKGADLNNEDILIMFAILCYNDRRLQKTRLYEQVNYLLDFKKYDLNLLKELHSQIYNVHGVWHGTYFEQLTKPYGSAEKLINGCNATYNSFSYVANIISRINPLAIHSERVSKVGTETLVKNLRECISQQSKKLDDIKRHIKDDWHTLPQNYVDELENTVNKLKEFHATLFIPYGIEEKRCGKPLTERVENVLKDIGESYKIDMPQKNIISKIENLQKEGLYSFWDKEKNEVYSICIEQYQASFTPKVREIWYVWDKRMEEEFKFLISDIRHCGGELEQRSFGKVNMIISFEFSEKSAKIILNTISTIDHNEIVKRLEEKSRYQREIIQRNGATIDYSSSMNGDKFLLTTILEIQAVC